MFGKSSQIAIEARGNWQESNAGMAISANSSGRLRQIPQTYRKRTSQIVNVHAGFSMSALDAISIPTSFVFGSACNLPQTPANPCGLSS
jgi:hypothetical protein